MLRHMALVRTDVSEERSTSIIRVTRIGELGTLAISSDWHAANVDQLLVMSNVAPSSPILVTLMIGTLSPHRNVGSYNSHMA
jgi:hypothetical protein